MKPIFLFSLPRSGSTLVQRILMSSKDVCANANEPWVLLPYLSTYLDFEVFSRYGYKASRIGMQEFFQTLPNGEKSYRDQLKQFILNLYDASGEGEKYYLDKTPRYAAHAGQIIDLFEDEAKYIVLTRNPVAIASSMIETWGKGKWVIPFLNVDLYDGFNGLIKCLDSNREKICHITYEDLMVNPDGVLEKLSRYLDVNLDKECLYALPKKIDGKFGDPSIKGSQNKISPPKDDGWLKSFNNPCRKKWAKFYTRSIGRSGFEKINIDFDLIERKIDNCSMEYFGMLEDMLRMLYGKLYNALSSFFINKPFKSNHD